MMPAAPSCWRRRCAASVCAGRSGRRRCRPRPAAARRARARRRSAAGRRAGSVGVGHRAEHVEQRLIEPAAPVLQRDSSSACCASGHDGGADQRVGPRGLHRGAHLDHERRQARAAEVAPALREQVRVGRRIEHLARVRLARSASVRSGRIDALNCSSAAAAVVEVLVREAHVVEVDAVDGVAS